MNNTESFDSITNFVDKIIIEAQETEDEFIFTTIRPFCEEIAGRRISKNELVRALLKQEKADDVLDKVRAELIEEKECAYADFERYKVEYLGQDWDDADDNLPQDDFRYGMERAIELIDKYKK